MNYSQHIKSSHNSSAESSDEHVKSKDLEPPYVDFIDTQLQLLALSSHRCKAPNRFYVLEWTAMSDILIKGYWAEFGVFEGSSMRVLASAAASRASAVSDGTTIPSAIYGFDSFRGFPPVETDGRIDWLTRRFDLGGTAPPAPPGVEFVAGWFSDTLPAFLLRDDVRGHRASLVHVDCDLRSSALYVLSELSSAGAIGQGTVVVFDELLHYPGYEHNEFRALWEWANAFDAEWEWVSPLLFLCAAAGILEGKEHSTLSNHRQRCSMKNRTPC